MESGNINVAVVVRSTYYFGNLHRKKKSNLTSQNIYNLQMINEILDVKQQYKFVDINVKDIPTHGLSSNVTNDVESKDKKKGNEEIKGASEGQNVQRLNQVK